MGHVQALLKLFDQNFHGCKAYNLGTGRGYSVLEVIEAFSKAASKNLNYEIVGRREGDIAASYADATLAQKELSWFATKDINDMCKDTWNWQIKNPFGFHEK